MLMQILAGAAGSIGFAILYNVRGRALAFALLGGALGLGLYALARRAFRSDGRTLRWCNAVGLACTALVLALTALLVAANA